MLPVDPATLFALKMALCLGLFLLGAAWLRRRIGRIQHARGLPPAGTSAAAALAHYLGPRPAEDFDHERRLYRQTIRVLARELRRLDPAHGEAQAALELLGETGPVTVAAAPRASQTEPQPAGSETSCGSGAMADRQPGLAACAAGAGPASLPMRAKAPAARRVAATLAGPLVWISAALWLGPPPAAQAEVAACGRETVGQLSLQAGVRCRCAQLPAGTVTGSPAGYGWDCGVLRGRLNQLVPAGPEGYGGPPVDAIVVEPDRLPPHRTDPRRLHRP